MKDQLWTEDSLRMTCFHISYSLCHILGALYITLDLVHILWGHGDALCEVSSQAKNLRHFTYF
jgi:hypothetical protein